MFKTSKAMAPFLIESLEDLLQRFSGKFVRSEILEGAKITLKLMKMDMSKQENRVSSNKIGIEFFPKYDMQQLKSSGKVTSENKFKADVCTFLIAMCKHMI